MTLLEAVLRLRAQLDDEQEPWLWSDWELIQFLDEAEREACRRSQLLMDDATSLTRVSLPSGTGRVLLDARILRVLRVQEMTGRPLQQWSLAALRGQHPGWEEWGAVLQPRYFTLEGSSHELRVIPANRFEMELQLTVQRLPLARLLEDATDATVLALDDPVRGFEIPEVYHDGLLAWARFRACSKPDGDTGYTALAQAAEAEFERWFGPRPDARAQERTLREPTRRAQPCFF